MSVSDTELKLQRHKHGIKKRECKATSENQLCANSCCRDTRILKTFVGIIWWDPEISGSMRLVEVVWRQKHTSGRATWVRSVLQVGRLVFKGLMFVNTESERCWFNTALIFPAVVCVRCPTEVGELFLKPMISRYQTYFIFFHNND